MVRRKKTEASLVNKTSLRVRFSEVDSMQIVWHGEYVRYFEDGREAFGREFAGLGYMDIYASGYTAPIVELHLQYRKPLKVNDTAVVETRYIATEAAGHRVVCVGTTSCRTVESACDENGLLQECCDNTEIFIYPGYRFKVLDALITNFHLPQSTLVMLVSALAGREHILDAYREAVKEGYRFFSFGDAMFIAAHPAAEKR